MDLIERMALAKWAAVKNFPNDKREHMKAILDAIRETHAIVPREPTDTMLEAARNAPRPLVHLDSLLARDDLESGVRWRAMIEAGEVKP